MIDLLLINPPSPDKSVIIRDFNRSGRTSRERIIWPQVSLAYMAAMVPKDFKVEIIDCIAEDINWDKLKSIIQEKQPRYLAAHVITSISTNDFHTFELAKSIVPNCITMSMGPHVTELYEESFQKCPQLDYVLRGEVELTFKELIEALESKRPVDEIKGLAYRKDGKAASNETRPFIEDLDSLPIPRQDLLPLKKYQFPFIASKFTFVMASRGCPYPCTFCRQPIMWAKKVRSRSAKSIMEELRMLKKLGIKSFLFHTDTFTINKKIVMELCQMMIDEKLNMSWGCNSRVDTVDKEMLQIMKKAGCWMIALGIESGSDKVLQLCKKEATVQQAIDTVKICHEVGLKIYGYFVIGLIGETKETIQETIDLSKKLPLTFAIFHVASPYPGTEFYDQVKEQGFLTNKRWEEINQGGTSPINYPQLSGKEIMQGIKKAYFSFYLRPSSGFKLLGSIKNMQDVAHLMRLVLDHLRW